MSELDRHALAKEVTGKMLELSKLIKQISPYYQENFVQECLNLHSEMLEHEAISLSEIEGFSVSL
jgi:cytochrome c556